MSGERPIGAASCRQQYNQASCQPPPPLGPTGIRDYGEPEVHRGTRGRVSERVGQGPGQVALHRPSGARGASCASGCVRLCASVTPVAHVHRKPPRACVSGPRAMSRSTAQNAGRNRNSAGRGARSVREAPSLEGHGLFLAIAEPKPLSIRCLFEPRDDATLHRVWTETVWKMQLGTVGPG